MTTETRISALVYAETLIAYYRAQNSEGIDKDTLVRKAYNALCNAQNMLAYEAECEAKNAWIFWHDVVYGLHCLAICVILCFCNETLKGLLNDC